LSNIDRHYVLRIVADDRLRITPTVAIPASDLTWRVSRSGGPGGQHANTSDTRVEVALDVRHCAGLTPPQRALVISRLGPVVRAVAADTRSQAKNRELARARLVGRLAASLRVSPTRRPTRASRGAREDRLAGKRKRGDVKRLRGRPDADD
jgi:ribosome-associated protein